MEFRQTALQGVLLVVPKVHGDERGFFLETYHQKRYAENGIPELFVQDNHSRSIGPILRGLHAQHRRPQGKLVRCVSGRIFDVAVDIRRGSPTFGRWTGYELSATNHCQLWVPVGFLHGFCVLDGGPAEVEYKCTDFYDPTDEIGVAWNDPEIGVEWPIQDPLLSPKDRALQPLRASFDRLPVWNAAPSA
jgi:dTDP-4-dehydrorhamnose 3,5-epimerase